MRTPRIKHTKMPRVVARQRALGPSRLSRLVTLIKALSSPRVFVQGPGHPAREVRAPRLMLFALVVGWWALLVAGLWAGWNGREWFW